MRIQIASDLHIEYLEDANIYNLIKPNAPILVLAGDIGSLYKYDQLKRFLEHLSSQFKYILYVPGNHEFYTIKNIESKSLKQLNYLLLELEKSINNLYILNKNCVKIQNICFIGCTLWSHIGQHEFFPYFRVRIKGLNKYLYNKYHQDHIKYINSMINECKRLNLTPNVITHYPPSLKCLKKKNDEYKYLYASDLEYMVKKIKYWICGHVHWNFNIQVGNSYIISNQKGKLRDNVTDYKSDFFLDI